MTSIECLTTSLSASSHSFQSRTTTVNLTVGVTEIFGATVDMN